MKKPHIHDPKDGPQPGTMAICPKCSEGWYYEALVDVDGEQREGVREIPGHPCTGGNGRWRLCEGSAHGEDPPPEATRRVGFKLPIVGGAVGPGHEFEGLLMWACDSCADTVTFEELVSGETKAELCEGAESVRPGLELDFARGRLVSAAA